MEEKNKFELALVGASKLPLIKIEREKYLRKELIKYCDENQIDKAIEYNPAYAGINIKIIDKIADSAIKYETSKVTLISATAGIPGGLAMVGTIPADITQYIGHLIRILQKLMYLYGWDELIENDSFDDETSGLITLFMGVMFGVEAANKNIAKIAASAAQRASKTIAQKALTKTIYYPVVKKIAASIGVKMTKDTFAKSVSKAIPLIGAATSGGLTYFTYKPMAKKLKTHLAGLKFCDVEYYKGQAQFI